ncbi:hypothetical protein AK812_SmicGene11866, partial [Symbiodinium microadriaticum]
MEPMPRFMQHVEALLTQLKALPSEAGYPRTILDEYAKGRPVEDLYCDGSGDRLLFLYPVQAKDEMVKARPRQPDDRRMFNGVKEQGGLAACAFGRKLYSEARCLCPPAFQWTQAVLELGWAVDSEHRGGDTWRHLDACPVEFPLSLTDSEHRGGDTWRHLDACPVEFPLSLTDSEHRGGDTWRHLDACPVEFPLSLTDSEHRGGDTWTRALWSLTDLNTAAARHLDAWLVEFPLSLRDSERHGGDTWRHLDTCPVEFPLSLTDSEHRGGDTWTRALWSLTDLNTAAATRGVKELYGVAAAASVPRFAQGRRLSREALLDALFWCIAQKEDDEAAASGQQLDVLREGF